MEPLEEPQSWLRQAGLRVTPQRLAVLEVLREASHPTAEDIFRAVTRRHPGVSFATVYNTLATLEAHGTVTVIATPEGRRYDTTVHPHQHIRCLRCGRIEDLPEWDGTGWVEATRPAGWRVDGWRLMVVGFCPACRGIT
jgi:Fur family peroxide stress response transcriptional regulator